MRLTRISTVTPPAAVGFANGIAQSIVSLARCFGPILGGYASAFHNVESLISFVLALVCQYRR